MEQCTYEVMLQPSDVLSMQHRLHPFIMAAVIQWTKGPPPEMACGLTFTIEYSRVNVSATFQGLVDMDSFDMA